MLSGRVKDESMDFSTVGDRFRGNAFCCCLIDEYGFAIIYCIAKYVYLYLLAKLVFACQRGSQNEFDENLNRRDGKSF
jgi:hypothetical protein